MPPSDLVVHLARCEHVPGFPALFAGMLAETGCRFYPEYIVYEEYRAYGQGQYMCEVNLVDQDRSNPAGRRYLYQAYGIGMTVDQEVQEAAHSAIAVYRGRNPYLATSDSAYWHFPAQDDTPQGVHTATYTEPDAGESARYQALAALV